MSGITQILQGMIKKMERNQFTFYKSFQKSIKKIKSAKHRAIAYDAICDFALDGVYPDFDKLPDIVSVALEAIIPVLESGRKKAKSGKQGGEANRKQTGSKQKQTQSKKKNKKKKKIKNKC